MDRRLSSQHVIPCNKQRQLQMRVRSSRMKLAVLDIGRLP